PVGRPARSASAARTAPTRMRSDPGESTSSRNGRHGEVGPRPGRWEWTAKKAPRSCRDRDRRLVTTSPRKRSS
ncbi:MAG: hypothetical protein WAK82_35920, partial [Streptosporangiaceae bacterium]